MSIFSNLILSVKGLFRNKANDLVDLRYAGKEKIREIDLKINKTQEALDALIGNRIVLTRDIKNKTDEVTQYEQAVKDHHQRNDETNKAKAYKLYSQSQIELNTLLASKTDIENQIETLQLEIDKVKKSRNQVANNLAKAANTQVLGKAIGEVESLHKDINSGSLSEVIEQSELNSAIAEGQRQQREENDGTAILEYQKEVNVKSLEQILGK